MRVAMQKVDGVEKVSVSLKDGLTVLDLKADNAVTLAKLREIIKNNGFVSRDAVVLARGTPSKSQATLTFEVSGTRERLAVVREAVSEGESLWRLTAPVK